MIVTVKGNAPIVVPPSELRKAGFKPGDKLKFDVCCNGVIRIRAKSEDVGDKLTPEDNRHRTNPSQRVSTKQHEKFVATEVEKGLAEIRRGDIVGPFKSTAEIAKWLKPPARKRANK